MKFHTNYDRAPAVEQTAGEEPSKTMQQFKDEADINHLIARYSATGSFYDALQVNPMQRRVPQFADFSEIGDFAAQQQKVLEVYEMFAALPAAIRDRFGNNPALFVEFCGQERNLEECVKLGIFEKAQTAPVAVNPAPASGGDGVAVDNPVKKVEE